MPHNINEENTAEDEDRNLIWTPPGVRTLASDQRDIHRPRVCMYHQTLAPKGKIFEKIEADSLDEKQWVDTPAKFVSKENWEKREAENKSIAEKARLQKEKAQKEGDEATARLAAKGAAPILNEGIAEKVKEAVSPKPKKTNGPKKVGE